MRVPLFLESYLNRYKNRASILDIGCGFGQMASWLGQRHPSWRVVGLDATRSADREAVESGISVTVADARTPAFSSAVFDFIHAVNLPVFWEGHEVFGGPQLVAEIARCLKNGGVAISLPAYHFGRFTYLRPSEIAALVSANGLEILGVHCYDFRTLTWPLLVNTVSHLFLRHVLPFLLLLGVPLFRALIAGGGVRYVLIARKPA